jgi:AcrR family transcriptional regulator
MRWSVVMIDDMSGTAAEDLTARARIRDAALRLFAEHGIAAVTIRDVAAAAGVSSGLIRHHFGVKEDLRKACDAYAKEVADDIRQQTLTEGRLADPTFFGTVQPTVMRVQRYLVRSMLDGSPTADGVFLDMVKRSERRLQSRTTDITDIRACAAVLVAMHLGMSILHDQISSALNTDVHTTAGHARMTRGLLDAFTHTFLTPGQVAEAYAALDGSEKRQA